MGISPPCREEPKPSTCDDCRFPKNLLRALELDEPGTTFRRNRPEGPGAAEAAVWLTRPASLGAGLAAA